MTYPSYIELHRTGELKARAKALLERLKDCDLCPRKCHVDRTKTTRGAICGVGRKALVNSAFAHFGEERVLVGQHGSGTIFFSGCNLGCVFCQNYSISHGKTGKLVTDQELGMLMLYLQKKGVHNINLVTPSHIVPQIISAIDWAAGHGLNIPIVYNTSAYDDVDTLRFLDGIVDIYMPDFKTWNSEVAGRYLKAKNYPDVAKKAIIQMHKQVGDLIIENGIARRGLLVRHLILPGGLSHTKEVVDFLAKLSIHTYVNIMDQYMPLGNAYRYPLINQPISKEELKEACRYATAVGLYRFDNECPV